MSDKQTDQLNNSTDKQNVSNNKTKPIVKHNFFNSIGNEINWLNKLGAQGFLLKKKSAFSYYFIKTDTTYSYSMEWLDSSPETEDNIIYINSLEKGGAVYCGARSCFIYLAYKSPKLSYVSDSALLKIKKRYTSLITFWSVVAAFFAGLIVYNTIYYFRFEKAGYVVKESSDIIGIFKFVIGHNPAKLFLLLLILIMMVILMYLAVYIIEYKYWNGLYKSRHNK